MRVTRLLLPLMALACTGGTTPGLKPADPAPEPSGPAPTLLVPVSRVETVDRKVVTRPARLLLIRERAGTWSADTLDDPESNVFHKAFPWRDGLLTVGGDAARVVHWTHDGTAWSPEVLWQESFGGEHDRMRDVEEGDVDGDGASELVVATHDRGIVGVGDEVDGAWTWTTLGARPSTFVHEIELGDLDGDGTVEIYATPSEPNQSSGQSQPGRVERWRHTPDGYVSDVIVAWEDTHAKEITVADLGQGPTLLALREGRTTGAGGLSSPVAVVQLVPGPAGQPFVETELAVLAGERQARFLVPGDVDGDGEVELVATGMTTGVWLLDRQDGTWRATQVDASSGGFEQAAHITDLDGDGRVELYVVSERAGKPRELRRYVWKNGAASRTILHTLEGSGLAWGLSDGVLP